MSRYMPSDVTQGSPQARYLGARVAMSHPFHPLDFTAPHLKDEGDNPHQTEHLGSGESHPCGCPWVPNVTTTP